MRYLLPSAFCAIAMEEPPAESPATDPPVPDPRTARSLALRWVHEEEKSNYNPENGSWPPRRRQGLRNDIPGLRSDLMRCGGVDNDQCHGIAFTLGVAYLGGNLFGHRDDGDRSAEEVNEGANLMRKLADHGSAEGACGYAYCLANGEGVDQDSGRAAHYHRQAAASGYAQSMHELGTMHYLGKHTRSRLLLLPHSPAKRMILERGAGI